MVLHHKVYICEWGQEEAAGGTHGCVWFLSEERLMARCVTGREPPGHSRLWTGRAHHSGTLEPSEVRWCCWAHWPPWKGLTTEQPISTEGRDGGSRSLLLWVLGGRLAGDWQPLLQGPRVGQGGKFEVTCLFPTFTPGPSCLLVSYLCLVLAAIFHLPQAVFSSNRI